MDSPFSSYLQTNYAPSQYEKHQIQMFLARPRRELQEINNDIAKYRQLLDDLTSRRDDSVRHIERHAALLSPIRGVPLDIIRLIFMFCVNDDVSFPNSNGDMMSPTSSPMLLTSVCQRWRAIALHLPSLWEKPCIMVPATREDMAQWSELLRKRAQLVRMWLSRASKRHLTISFISPPSAMITVFSLQPLIQALTSFSSQWKCLRLQLPVLVLGSFLSIPIDSVPNLQNIDLLHVSTLNGSSLYGPGTNLITGSSIRQIRLSIGNDTRKFMALPLQWHQFTHMFIVEPPKRYCQFSDEDALIMLSKCTSLRRFQTYISHVPLARPFDESPVSCPELTSLDLKLPHLLTSNLFSFLSLPNLQTLRLSSTATGEWLVPIIGQHASSLRHLDLSVTGLSVQDLLQLLSQVEQLESLELSYRPYSGPLVPLMTDDLLVALTPPGSAETTSLSPNKFNAKGPLSDARYHCPNLESLTFVNKATPRINDQAICAFIKARMRLSSPTLRSVAITQTNFTQQLDVRAELEREGVKLDWLSLAFNYQDPQFSSTL